MSDDVHLTLPGEWWRVPLDSEQSTIRAATRMARSLYPGDELATLRREIRDLVGKAAEEARAARARNFWFAREIVPGVPIPLTLSMYAPELPQRMSADASPLAAADGLAGAIDDDQGAVSTWAQGVIGVMRHLRLLPATGDDAAPTLRVDYWLAQGQQTTVFAFSSPLLWEETAEPLLELTDAVVATVEWTVAAPAGAPSTGGVA